MKAIITSSFLKIIKYFLSFWPNHDQILTKNYTLVNDYRIKWIMKMSLIYSSVKKGLPLLECPYFYWLWNWQMRLRFRSMNSESKYKSLNYQIKCTFSRTHPLELHFHLKQGVLPVCQATSSAIEPYDFTRHHYFNIKKK